MIDLHLHTSFSHDSAELPQNYLARAQNLGAEAIGFAEHYDYDFALVGQCLGLPDLDGYFSFVGEDKLKVLHGIELGYSRGAAAFYKSFVNSYTFDYIINSVHMLPDGACSKNPVTLDEEGVRSFYRRYLCDVLESVRADYDYQIVGHIGYASRYVFGKGKKLRYKDYSDIYDLILSEIISRGKCLELNTSSFGTGGDFLPDRDVFKRYFELGGRLVSFGSDAHRAEDIFRSYRAAADFLLAAGIDRLCYYVGRELRFSKL